MKKKKEEEGEGEESVEVDRGLQHCNVVVKHTCNTLWTFYCLVVHHARRTRRGEKDGLLGLVVHLADGARGTAEHGEAVGHKTAVDAVRVADVAAPARRHEAVAEGGEETVEAAVAGRGKGHDAGGAG